MQVDPGVPLALNNIVLKAMEKNPAARFQSAEEFRNALRSLRQPQAEPAAVPGPVLAPVSAQAAAAFSATAIGAGSWLRRAGVCCVRAGSKLRASPAAGSRRTGKNQPKAIADYGVVMGAVAAVLAIVAVATVVPRFYPHAGRA